MSEMVRVPGLVRRGNSYVYRRRVPADIADRYGKREELIALGTSDARVAEKRARVKASEVELRFEEFRRSSGMAAVEAAAPGRLTTAQLKKFCDQHYLERVASEPAKRHALLEHAHPHVGRLFRGTDIDMQPLLGLSSVHLSR